MQLNKLHRIDAPYRNIQPNLRLPLSAEHKPEEQREMIRRFSLTLEEIYLIVSEKAKSGCPKKNKMQ